MRLDYVGQRRFGDEYTRDDNRFGVLVANEKEAEKAEFIVDKLHEDGYQYNAFGDSEETAYWFTVEDHDDFDNLKECYKEAKKAYTQSKRKDNAEHEQ